ncbi:MAG TPA: metal-dependent hydrolase [Candidatus Saccharimonadales bacterium]|nr:metal-dependent hydrolase [Candidatus Saccharimonadales bacterium]
MTGRTHDLAAITALGVIVIFEPLRAVTLSTVLVSVLANQIGGILPDIDQPTAPFWRNLPIGGLFGRVFDKLLGGHRFLTHSLLGVALFAFLARALLAFVHPLMPHVNVGLVWWAFLIGILSHLIMDSFTKEGVPWLLPVPVKFGIPPAKALRITTGKFAETLIVFPGLLAFDAWLCASHYQTLMAFVHHYLV